MPTWISRIKRHDISVVWLVCALLFFSGASSPAQAHVHHLQPPEEQAIQPPPSPDDKQANALLKENYARNLDDLRHMQRLLSEVRTEMTKDSAYVLSLQSIKKLEQIEKLSKSIRTRMRVQ